MKAAADPAIDDHGIRHGAFRHSFGAHEVAPIGRPGDIPVQVDFWLRFGRQVMPCRVTLHPGPVTVRGVLRRSRGVG